MKKHQLTTITPLFYKLKKLKYLDLSNNKLEMLPISIFGLINLETLLLNNNKLTSLFVAKLTKLTTLNIEENNLHFPPIGLQALTKLSNFNIIKNPLGELPPQVSSLDVSLLHKGILQYYEEIENEKVEWNRVKCVILGKESTGKTTIINRFLNMKTNENISTDGIQFTDILLKNETQNTFFRFCDFGGQSVFYPTHQFFLSDRSIYIIVFDASEQDFKSRVEYWLNTISNIVKLESKVFCILIASHKDHCTTQQIEFVNQVIQGIQNNFKFARHFLFLNLKEDPVEELINVLLEISSRFKKNKEPVIHFHFDKFLQYNTLMLKQNNTK
eukprot:TRINITY_DN10346_c0_g1_i1.p1 TRINITY_DN10346_c0_g1~~TRINITY_DN10346_c0_g1_i1.p1  ORF type:complete len:357 (-),score=82.16 TRINITY_DN10346_c0_g1_i1:348-1334(-)